MDYPPVSVVIATRNRPQMLRSALQAIVNQSYSGIINVLVVFDRTEPDPDLVLQGDRRTVKVLTNSRSAGLAGARNSGILSAGDPFVAFCDDDDIWKPGKLSRQIEAIGTAITSVTGITVEYGGKRTDRIPLRDTFTLDNVVRTRQMAAHPSTVLMRRDAVLDRIGLVDEEIPGSYGEDFDYMIRALEAGEVSVVEEALVSVHWGQSQFSKDWSTIVRAIDYLIEKHECIRRDRRALARLYGRRGFATAAMKERRSALRDVVRTLRLSPLEKRAYLTVPVAFGLISGERVLDFAHQRGRGV